MKWLSDLRASYRKTQRLFAERALRQGKRRFVFVHMRGVLLQGCLIFLVVMVPERWRDPSPWSMRLELAFAAIYLLLLGIYGYLSAGWKWKDYQRLVKPRLSS